jgi:hypothetical protein
LKLIQKAKVPELPFSEEDEDELLIKSGDTP